MVLDFLFIDSVNQFGGCTDARNLVGRIFGICGPQIRFELVIIHFFFCLFLQMNTEIDPNDRVHSRFVYEQEDVEDDFWRNPDHGLSCWHDTEPFVGPVFSYPIRKENDTWIVRGVFCSLHCAKRYIVENCFVNTNTYTLFALMCAKIYGCRDEVVAAPQRELLAKFSTKRGMTIDELRAAGPTSMAIQLVMPPIFPFKFPKAFVCKEDKNKQPDDANPSYQVLMKNDNVMEEQPKKKRKVTTTFPSHGLSSLGSYFPKS